MARPFSKTEKATQKQFRFYPSMLELIEKFVGDEKESTTISAYIKKAVESQLKKDCKKAGIKQWRIESILSNPEADRPIP